MTPSLLDLVAPGGADVVRTVLVAAAPPRVLGAATEVTAADIRSALPFSVIAGRQIVESPTYALLIRVGFVGLASRPLEETVFGRALGPGARVRGLASFTSRGARSRLRVALALRIRRHDEHEVDLQATLRLLAPTGIAAGVLLLPMRRPIVAAIDDFLSAVATRAQGHVDTS